MRCYLTGCVAGFIAFDEDLNLIDYELFQMDKISDDLIDIQRGLAPEAEKRIIERLMHKFSEVVVESPEKRDLKEFREVKFQIPTPAGEYLRENLHEIMADKLNIENPPEFIHDVLTDLTLEKLKESFRESDKFIIQAISALDEIDEAMVKLIERLREWYSLHFPELDEIKSHDQYAELVAEYGDRKHILSNFKLDIRESIGSEIVNEDLEIFRELAENFKNLHRLRENTEAYIDLKMEKMAPNLRDVAGSNVGARLIAHAGGLKELAMLPSSTIQILGAEKALFRHLKSRAKPPKHGVIFQHPAVRSSPWWIRGKVSRLLAGKIALAVRKDVFSQEFDPGIAEGFNARFELIKKNNPSPPPRKPIKRSGKVLSRQKSYKKGGR